MLNTNIIGNKIVEARKKKNLSQAELARKISISSQAVGKWERGESIPDLITFNEIAKVLDVDLNYFSDDFESKEIKEQNNNEKITFNMSCGDWKDADFSGLKNLNDKFSSSNIQSCKFDDADLGKIVFKSNNIDNNSFVSSNFTDSNFSSSNIIKNNFMESNLTNSNFKSSNLSNNDFSKAILKNVEFNTSAFSKNIVIDTIWDSTKFKYCGFADMTFEGKITNCSFEDCKFSKTIFKDVIFTNTFFKNNRNFKKIRFENCKADNITYAFLKNNKVSLEGIELL
ncbi:MAG: helix-turn-helix domain-containing protein [Ignavibacteriales bacterium]